MPGADVTDDPTALARAGTQQTPRYMILRDIQLAVPHGRTPDTAAAAGQTAKWLSGKVYDTQACRKDSNPGVQLLSGRGFCGHTTVYDENQKIVDRANDTVWLFTINGQNYPDVTIQPGETELWRIANLSPTVTYTLELVDGADNETLGAGVRTIHQACQKVLQEHLDMEPVLKAEEKSMVEVPVGFDASAIRLTGNVTGSPPFKGSLEHHGWRYIKFGPDDFTILPALQAPWDFNFRLNQSGFSTGIISGGDFTTEGLSLRRSQIFRDL